MNVIIIDRVTITNEQPLYSSRVFTILNNADFKIIFIMINLSKRGLFMKKILLAISFLSSFGFAKNINETCFKSLNSADTEVPKMLCMNDLGLYNNGDLEWITVYGGNMAGNYEIGKSFDGSSQTSLEIEKFEAGPCAYSRSLKIILKLNDQFSDQLNANTIKVSVEKETLRDSCHSFPETEEILFQKIK
jgi:hypothetical protein